MNASLLNATNQPQVSEGHRRAPQIGVPELLPSADDQGGTADIGAFLRALRRRWPLALILGLAALLGVAAAALRWLPQRYAARALIQIDSTRSGLIPNPSTDARVNFLYFQRGQLALVKNRGVLQAALSRPGVADLPVVKGQSDPVAWLEKQLRADFTVAPEILRLMIAGEDAASNRVILAAVVDAYLDETIEKERRPQTERLDRLKKLQDEYTASLADKRRAIRELAETLGASDPTALSQKQQPIAERAGEEWKELKQLQLEARQARLELASLAGREGAGDEGALEALIDEAVQKSPAVVQLNAEIAKLEQEIADFKQTAVRGDREPAIQPAVARLGLARDALAAKVKELRPAAQAQVREKSRAEIRGKQGELQARVKFLEGLEAAARDRVNETEGKLTALNKEIVRLSDLRAETASVEDVLKKVNAQIETLKIETQVPPRVTPLEEPTDVGADGKNPRLIAAGTGLAAAGLVVFLVGFLEFRSQKVGTSAEITRALRLPLVGSLPAIPRHRRLARALPLADGEGASRSVLIESADAVSARVQRAARDESLRVLMVTSACSGEGKTALAEQLAASLARSGFKTLLVDGDLRHPALHTAFGLDRGPGLVDVLLAAVDPRHAVQPTGMDGLSVLPAGRWDPQALQALAQRRFGDILAALRAEYDFVIVDSPPVLPVPDALLIGQDVDAVLFSVLQDVSRLPLIAEASTRIDALGIRVLGAVVNGVPTLRYGAY